MIYTVHISIANILHVLRTIAAIEQLEILIMIKEEPDYDL